MPSIAEIDFSSIEPQLCNPKSIRGFQCSRGEFRSFLKDRIPRDIEKYMCQCWALIIDDKLAGYITLLSDRLTIDGLKVLKHESIPYDSFPAIKIGLLASDKRLKGKGIGTRLVVWAINHVISDVSGSVGVRFITVDALYDKDKDYDASGFYKGLGFKLTHPEQSLPPKNAFRSMYLDLKPVIEAVHKSDL